LIGSGTNCNFVSTNLASELGLQVEGTPPYCVKLGDGCKKKTSWFFNGIEVQREGYKVRETFFLFELGGVDLILGVTWLASLGEVKVNRFNHEFYGRGSADSSKRGSYSQKKWSHLRLC